MVAAVTAVASVALAAQAPPRTDVFVESRDHPAIAYTAGPVHNAVNDLNDQLRRGTTKLPFEPATGYLRSLLTALGISIDSQTLVFSQTSQQADQINPSNPRAVYFNDTVAVGWVRGADALEIAAHDPRQGAVFYTLPQKANLAPRLGRDNGCLLCHLTWDTLGVPGFQVVSTFQMSDDPNAYASGLVSDHRTPLADRWGGWYVTGQPGTFRHRGNVPVVVKAQELKKPPQPAPPLASVAGKFDTRGFLSEQSDVVALMVLEHQTHMTNLLTRVGWEARVWSQSAASPARADRSAKLSPRVLEAVRDLVDYMLFIDEAPLSGQVQGTSGFAQRFAGLGPRDQRGRSLRQFDLQHHLFRYRCSYMVYAPAFDALIPEVKNALYARMWEILSGADRSRPYAGLQVADRRAIIEILKETKKDLPASFQSPIT
jgi:hypothetical protein